MSEFFIDVYPEIAKDITHVFHPTLTLKDLKAGSVVIVAYKNECGHVRNVPLRELIGIKKGCPYCNNRKLLVGFNDVETRIDNDKCTFSWDDSNKELSSSIIFASNKKYNWRCNKCSYIFSKTPYALFFKNVKCPYCNNKELIVGFNDIATTHPEPAAEWDHEENYPLLPTQIIRGSAKKVAWKCDKGHQWNTTIATRTSQKTQCPYCKNRKVLAGFNDVATTHPHILKEWDYEKNEILPTEITFGSDTQIWWKCQKGHSQSSTFYGRASNKRKCLTCINHRVLAGFNDVATTHPQLLKEWDYEKNEILPTEITAGSDTQIWWKCEKGHSFASYAYHRTNSKAGTKCPSCTTATSSLENDFVAYIRGVLPPKIKSITGDKTILGDKEIDLYIPDMKIAFEFNGMYWHSEKVRKDKNYHYNKWLKCNSKGIQLIQVWEDDWRNKNELVKTMLSYKLGVSNTPNIYARNTRIKNVSYDEATVFMKKNHIQGSTSGGIRIGLVDKSNEEETLVALMILKTEPKTNKKTFNLLRYSTSKPVVGGFTKLLSHVSKSYEVENIITFSDHFISDGKLYSENEFLAVSEIKPDYMYVIKNQRIHKFNYRLKRFKTDDNLIYQEGLTERELANLNGLNRIWDAGKTKWQLKIT